MVHISKKLVQVYALLFLISPNFVFAESRANGALESELVSLITAYNEAGSNVKKLIQKVKWSGITDERLFSLIEGDLIDVPIDLKNKRNAETVSLLLQGLAFSGNEDYTPILKRFSDSPNKKIRRNARNSLESLPKFRLWNPIISANLSGVSLDNLQHARIRNMLNANDVELVRVGASTVYHHFPTDIELQDLVANKLDLYSKKTRETFNDTNVVSWLCKSLGRSDNPEYIPLLRRVESTIGSSRVENWARISIEKLGGATINSSDRYR